MGDKGFDQISTGSLESFRTTEICGVRFNKSRIEVVLADGLVCKLNSYAQPVEVKL